MTAYWLVRIIAGTGQVWRAMTYYGWHNAGILRMWHHHPHHLVHVIRAYRARYCRWVDGYSTANTHLHWFWFCRWHA